MAGLLLDGCGRPFLLMAYLLVTWCGQSQMVASTIMVATLIQATEIMELWRRLWGKLCGSGDRSTWAS